jgi:tetratricopeptide (TPR) repeat protein
MAAYNGMTVYYRREGKLEAAERVCMKAVALARNAGLWDVEATNTGNLGNVYRDAESYAKARECYEAVIRIGTEKGSKHHVAFGKEQLACILTDEGDPAGSLRIGDDALALWREVGDAYREANTENDQGWRYGELKRHFEAGKSYERAAAAWMRAGIFDTAASAFGRAIGQYVDSRDYREAARCFEAAWSKMAVPEHAEEALRLLRTLVPVEVQVVILLDVLKIAESAGPLFSLVANRRLALDAAAAISAVCKHLRGEFGNRAYLRLLRSLAECCRGTSSVNAIVGLAFGIEQSPKAAVEATEFGQICALATQAFPDLRYRNDNLVGERWTLILQASESPAVEIEVVDRIPGVRAAVAITMLLLWASRHAIVKQMGRQKWRRIGIEIAAFPVDACKSQGIEVPNYVCDETPCVLAKLTNPGDTRPTSLPLMICDDFLAYARACPKKAGFGKCLRSFLLSVRPREVLGPLGHRSS